MTNTKIKKLCTTVLNILLYLFLAVCVVALVLTLFSKKDVDGAAEIFGYQMRVVTSDSMAECELTDVTGYSVGSIPVRSMVFVEVMPQQEVAADEWYRSLKVGDVLTFRYVYTNQVTITHRIISVTEKSTGGFVIELAGDNKNTDSGQLTQVIDTSVYENPDYVIGKVTGQSRFLGFAVSVFKTPLGIVFAVIVPCLIIIMLEVIKIVSAFSAQKKQQKEQELAELRRRLAELEAQNNDNSAQEDKAR